MGQLVRRLADVFGLAEHAAALDLLQLLDHPSALARPRRLLTPDSHWHEHIPFALYLVDILRPRLLVELGAHHGVSYCAFCQAIQQLGLDTRAYAVDSWVGDPHTGEYGHDILANLRAHHDPLYGGWSTLVQAKFDDAVVDFKDGTIDLLHIDGYHTYEAVQHDFATWLPKVSARGVVLFHDTNVRDQEFGVYRLLQELRTRYPTFEFLHGNGLGLVAVGQACAPELQTILNANEEQVRQIQDVFAELGRSISAEYDSHVKGKRLAERLAICQRHIQEHEEGRTEYERVIAAQYESMEEYARTIQALEKYVADLITAHRWHEATLAGREEAVTQLNTQLADVQQALATRTKEQDQAVQALTALTHAQQGQLAALAADSSVKDQQIQSMTGQLVEEREHVQSLTAQIALLNQQLQGLTAQAHKRNDQIDQLNTQIAGLNEQIEALVSQHLEKDVRIQALSGQLSDLEAKYAPLTSFTGVVREVPRAAVRAIKRRVGRTTE